MPLAQQLLAAFAADPNSATAKQARAVEVDDTNYEFTHGRRPSGYGCWAFGPKKNTDCMLAFWVTGKYGEARRAAQFHFAALGADVIYPQT